MFILIKSDLASKSYYIESHSGRKLELKRKYNHKFEKIYKYALFFETLVLFA